MVFYKDYKHQQWLLPPNLEDIISDEHICYLLDEVIDSIKFKDVEVMYEGPGHPAYHPRIIIKLLLMGMIDGIRSSRKIGKNTKENVVYMFLAGKLSPNFRTISDFRKNNPELIELCFKEIVSFAKKLDMIRLGHIMIDGTKIKASASNDKTLKKDELLFFEELIKNEIQKGIIEDETEDEIYGEDKEGNELPDDISLNGHIKRFIKKKIEEEKINCTNERVMRQIAKAYIKGDEKRKNEILVKIDDAKKEMEKSGTDVISFTDPESRFMKNKKGMKEYSYNAQITVDEEYGIILANDVTQKHTDMHQLIPQIEKVEETVGTLPENTEVSADNGYFDGENLRFLNVKNLAGYIPDKNATYELKGKKISKKPFGKDAFEYDWGNDEYICPAGERVTFRYEFFEKSTNRQVRMYRGTKCKSCVHNIQCVNKKMGRSRRIRNYGYEKEIRCMNTKMSLEENKKTYKKRAKTVECVFGDTKQNMGLREFLTRGINNVKTEFILACTAHNLKRMWYVLTERGINIQRISSSC